MRYLIIFSVSCLLYVCNEAKFTENELKQYLYNVFEKEASNWCYRSAAALFDFETDYKNKTKEERSTNLTLEMASWEKTIWQKYFKDLIPEEFTDPLIKRQVKYLHILGNSALDNDKLAKLSNVTNEMTGIYNNARICPYQNQNCDFKKDDVGLEPDIENIMIKSTDYDELFYLWKSRRVTAGMKMRDLYINYVELSNEAAKANNFSDKGALWRVVYEDPDFIKNMDNLWLQVEPLYNELHKYVASKLKKHYGNKLDLTDGLIPAHILDYTGDSWGHLAHLVRPFPNATKTDVDAALKQQQYTVLDLFRKSDEFYQSLGLLPMGMCYNERAGAMIRRPTDGREVLCHGSAWDLCNGHDFRLKMCTSVTFEYFKVIHHEMGHIQYFLQYKDQPFVFRQGANPGFHEAIGDTILLSVSTPHHLVKINLLTNFTDTYENTINTLMDMALEKVVFLPFGLLVDKWRWDVFNRSVPVEKWNSHWWSYRMKYQKVRPPVERVDSIDFDPGTIYHITSDSQYIAYFVAHILQFQFYKSLCIEAKQYAPNNETSQLHHCDFYKSKAAGDKLKAALSLGSSKHWTETLDALTGTRKVSAQALMEYFKPLYEYLKSENSWAIMQ